MIKLSSNGRIIWRKQYSEFSYGYGSALSIARELSNGDIIACGGGEVSDTNLPGIILKVDSDGNQLWLRNYVLQQPNEEIFNDIRLTSDDGFVSCGFIYGSTENIWVVKTDSLGCDTTECNFLGVEELKRSDQGIMVFPNPNRGVFTIQMDNGQLTIDNDKIEIYNVYGQEIYSKTIQYPHFDKLNASLTTIHLNVPDGVYFYRILQEDGSLVGSGKVIIVK